MVVRTIYKKRVGPEGREIDCEQDANSWVDIKETKKTKYEQGRGEAYRKTIYEHCNAAERRKYDEDPPEKITFKNPNSESQKIEYLANKGPNHGTVKRLWIEAGKGEYYQKTRLEFCNSQDNETRKMREQRVENEDTGDYIMVERIKRFTNEWGKGEHFQRKRVEPCNNEENIKDSEGDCKEIPA